MPTVAEVVPNMLKSGIIPAIGLSPERHDPQIRNVRQFDTPRQTRDSIATA